MNYYRGDEHKVIVHCKLHNYKHVLTLWLNFLWSAHPFSHPFSFSFGLLLLVIILPTPSRTFPNRLCLLLRPRLVHDINQDRPGLTFYSHVIGCWFVGSGPMIHFQFRYKNVFNPYMKGYVYPMWKTELTAISVLIPTK